MNSGFGYTIQNTIKNYHCLRHVAIWAGTLGVLQSLLWIGLTITGILGYTCTVPLDTKVNTGSIVGIVLFQMYFKSDHCKPEGYVDISWSQLNSVNRVLDPLQILIWDCVYLGVAVCWLLASVLLMTHLKKNCVKTTSALLYTWVFVTLAISLMDLALGIIFGIDFGNYQWQASNCQNCSLNDMDGSQYFAPTTLLLAGAVASFAMLLISFKGFVLWIINVGLLSYLFVQAVIIATDKDSNDTLFMPRKESDDDILTTRPPINAYEELKTTTPNAYVNEAFVVETRPNGVIELNEESIARAARMSNDASLQERRFRNLDAFQQYPPSRYSNNSDNSPKQDNIVSTTPFPQPDYSPPMSRANASQSHNGMLRNDRYQ